MRFQPRRKQLAIGAIVLAACSFGGGAYAATQDSGSAATPQAFLNDVAKRLGVTPQKLSAAYEGAVTDQLNAAVKAGKLTQAQANAIERRTRQRGALPFGFVVPGPPGFFHFGLARGPGAAFGAAAKYLGISTSALRSELRSGKTLGQIATEHGKSVAGLKRAVASAIRSRLPRIGRPRPWPPGAFVPPPGAFVPPPGALIPPPTPPAAS